jgi:hypothetical protein
MPVYKCCIYITFIGTDGPGPSLGRVNMTYLSVHSDHFSGRSLVGLNAAPSILKALIPISGGSNWLSLLKYYIYNMV